MTVSPNASPQPRGQGHSNSYQLLQAVSSASLMFVSYEEDVEQSPLSHLGQRQVSLSSLNAHTLSEQAQALL